MDMQQKKQIGSYGTIFHNYEHIDIATFFPETDKIYSLDMKKDKMDKNDKPIGNYEHVYIEATGLETQEEIQQKEVDGSSKASGMAWEVADGGNGFTYHGHPDNMDAVAWLPDSKSVASSVWEVNDHPVEAAPSSPRARIEAQREAQIGGGRKEKSVERAASSLEAQDSSFYTVIEQLLGDGRPPKPKSVENHAILIQEATGSVGELRRPPEIGTSLEGSMPVARGENGQGYLSQMDTFEFPPIPGLSRQPERVVQDGPLRWRIFAALVAILIISLLCIGIFGAYLLGMAMGIGQ